MVPGGGAQTEGGVTQVTMPQLGESVTEGQISRWLKQPGDTVEKYEALVEVITDKVNAEVPSPMAGTLLEIKVQEGETVAVGTLICTLGGGGGIGAEEAPAQPSVPAPVASVPPAAPCRSSGLMRSTSSCSGPCATAASSTCRRSRSSGIRETLTRFGMYPWSARADASIPTYR